MIDKLIIIPSDSVMWGGNQIGFFVDATTIEMSISNEDFDNGEISDVDKADIVANLHQIRLELQASGYKLIEEQKGE